MWYLNTFAAVVLVCFSFASDCFGQKVEVKLDSVFFESDYHGKNLKVDSYLITVDSKPFIFIDRKFHPVNLQPGYKWHPNFFTWKIRNLENHILAEIQQVIEVTGNVNRKAKLIKGKYHITFNHNDEYLEYQSNNDLIEDFSTDLNKFKVVVNHWLHKPGLRKLFLAYNQDVTNSKDPRYLGKIEKCGFGSEYAPLQSIDLVNNECILNDNLYNKCKFSISSMLNDSTIKTIKFYKKDKEFIGEATFLSIDYKNILTPIIYYKFVSFDNEKFIIKALNRRFINYYDSTQFRELLMHNPKASYTTIVKNNPDFIGCILHPKVYSQIVDLASTINDKYFL